MPTKQAYLPFLLGAMVVASPLFAQQSQQAQPVPPPDQLSDSSLEEIANAKILVSSVSRKEEDLDQAPAAVFVITREEIARSTASSIPELLRGVPGLQVAQLTASTWAISARGFNSAFADKLLVLIDGRTVYSEVYSGVHWDEIDMPLNNIERIEIIRGPGAVVWGANAANGVINIITRPARDMNGTLIGTHLSNTSAKLLVEQGGTLGDGGQYRGFVSFIKRRGLVDSEGNRAFDGSTLIRGGGRLDYRKSATNAFNLLGDVYRGGMRQEVQPFLLIAQQNGQREHDSIAGGFLQGAWVRTHGTASTTVQAYFVNSTRTELSTTAKTKTAEVEMISHRHLDNRMDLVWGGEARYTNDRVSGASHTEFPNYNNYLVGGFVQADFTLLPDKLIATVGTKLQDGTFTGPQLQPSARLLWRVNASHSLWAAFSRAVVAPSLQNKSIRLPLVLGTYNGLPIVATLYGNTAFKPVEVVASEVGYRSHLSRNLALDVAAFVNRNRRLSSLTPMNTTIVFTPTPQITLNELYTNGYGGFSEGIEGNLTWRPVSNLQTRASYSWSQAQIHQRDPGSLSLVESFATPKNIVSGDVSWTIHGPWQANAQVHYVGRIPLDPNALAANGGNSRAYIPSYTRLDVNLTRRLGSATKLEVGGTNLLQAQHLEFSGQSSFVLPHYVPRTAFARASWSF